MISDSPGSPKIHYVAKNDLELVIFLPPKYWDYRHVLTFLVLWGTGDRTQDFVHANQTLY